MKVVALISGGKDSCYNMLQCVAEGHTIVALANLKPKDKDELDSYMYQTVGHHAIELYSEAMGVPLYRRTIQGSSVEQGKDYAQNAQDEVEDLYELLKQVQTEHSIEAVSVGAILSDYQRVRVEHVCVRLGLTALSYLWRRDQQELLQEMIDCQIHAIIIKVAALGLKPERHLGRTLAEIQPHMAIMKEKYGLNVCGEGGEYETFTLDCPLFNKRIIVDDMETVIHSQDAFAPVGYLNLTKIHLEDKSVDPNTDMLTRVKDLPLKRSSNLLKELFAEDNTVPALSGLGHLVLDTQEETCAQCVQNRLQAGDYSVSGRHKSGFTWLAGIAARKTTEDDNIEELTSHAMERLKGELEKIGGTMKDLVRVHVYVRNMEDFAHINSVYKTYFDINPPARVCVQVPLPDNVALQVDCVAYHNGIQLQSRHTMHVQGLSHWAPANIGPYSQSVQIGKHIYVAGQIPLCPASMQIIDGILPQCRLSLRHVQRVLAAMTLGTNLRHIVQAVCYVPNKTSIQHADKEWHRAFGLSQKPGESWTGEEQVEPLVTYVVVPALPRSAAVEWQVYAHTDIQHWTGASLQSRVRGVCITCHYRALSEDSQDLGTHSHQISLQATAEATNSDVEGTADIEQVLQAVLQLCCRAASQVAADCCLPGVQIFYRQSLYSPDDLQQAYRKVQQSLNVDRPGLIPCAACIPVLDFSSSQCLLSICG